MIHFYAINGHFHSSNSISTSEAGYAKKRVSLLIKNSVCIYYSLLLHCLCNCFQATANDTQHKVKHQDGGVYFAVLKELQSGVEFICE